MCQAVCFSTLSISSVVGSTSSPVEPSACKTGSDTTVKPRGWGVGYAPSSSSDASASGSAVGSLNLTWRFAAGSSDGLSMAGRLWTDISW